MRVLDEHRCTRHHRNARTFLACTYPNLRHVSGSGYIAVVSTCDDVAVALFERLRPARIHLNEISVFGCAKGCVHDHFIAAVDIDGPTDQEAA